MSAALTLPLEPSRACTCTRENPFFVRLAGEPRGKGRPRFARATGRAYTPPATAEYEGNLTFAATRAMGGALPMDGPLVLHMRAVFAIPVGMSKGKRALAVAELLRPMKTPDVDNLMKTIDALNRIVFGDDKQIVESFVTKVYGEAPGLEIMIWPWVAGQFV